MELTKITSNGQIVTDTSDEFSTQKNRVKKLLRNMIICFFAVAAFLGAKPVYAADATYELSLDGTWMSSAYLPNTYLSTIVSHNYTFTLSEASVVTFTSQRDTLGNARYYIEQDGTSYLEGYLSEGLDDSVTVAFNAGTYTLRIATTRYFEYSGTYQVKAEATPITVTETEPNDASANAMTLAQGETVNGLLTVVDDRYDWYTFTVPTASKVTITTTVSLGHLSFIVYGSDLQRVHEDTFWYNVDGSASSPSTESVTFELEAGTYYIKYYNTETDDKDQMMAVYSVKWTRKVPVTSITVSGASSVNVGSSITLSAYILPTDASNQAVTWSSSNTDIAVVTSDGKVTGLSEGTVTIFAIAKDGTSVVGSKEITVTRASQTLSVSSSSVTLAVGKTSTPTVSGAKTTLSYKSSDTSVATVSSSGKITAKKVGTVTITVTAAQTSAYSKATATITVKVKPAATTVTSVTNTASGVKITWDKVTGATGYYVYRATSKDGTYTQIAKITSGSTVTYTNKTSGTYKVTSGKTYYYKVSAYASTGTASKSAAKSVKYLTAGKISSLTNTSSGITVKWSEVSAASGYYVYRKTSSGSYSKVKTVKSASTVSWTDTGVKSKNGTTYTYKVVPYSGSNTGSFTAQKTVRMTAVSLSSVKNSSSKKMTVKWAKNSKATGYQIQYSTSSSFASGNKTVTVSGASSTSKVISSLTKSKTYYVRIRAYKTVSGTKYYSAWSSKKSVKISK